MRCERNEAEELPARRAAIVEAHVAAQWGGLHAEVHAFKSSAGAVYAGRLQAVSQRLQVASKAMADLLPCPRASGESSVAPRSSPFRASRA